LPGVSRRSARGSADRARPPRPLPGSDEGGYRPPGRKGAPRPPPGGAVAPPPPPPPGKKNTGVPRAGSPEFRDACRPVLHVPSFPRKLLPHQLANHLSVSPPGQLSHQVAHHLSHVLDRPGPRRGNRLPHLGRQLFGGERLGQEFLEDLQLRLFLAGEILPPSLTELLDRFAPLVTFLDDDLQDFGLAELPPSFHLAVLDGGEQQAKGRGLHLPTGLQGCLKFPVEAVREGHPTPASCASS